MAALYDHVGMTTVSTGTGTLTLGSALTAVGINAVAYQSFAGASVPNGTVVSYLILDSNGNWEVGTGTYTSSGTTLSRTPTASSNGGSAINLSGSAQVFITIRAEDLQTIATLSTIPLPQSYLAGLQLSNDGTSPNSVIDVTAGQCRDSTNTYNITLGAFTKSTAGSWTAGSGSNGMGNGLTVTANTWYHVHAIINGGVSDAYFDTSVTAANAPSGTTAYRRLGSMATDSSAHIDKFSQDGDEFLWGTPTLEQSGASIPTSATLLTLVGVPPGVKVWARMRMLLNGGSANGTLVQSPDETSAIANAISGNDDAAWTSGQIGANLLVRTNTSAQVRWSQAGTGGTAAVVSYGWIDRRGRDN
jgi:hypothetical protein